MIILALELEYRHSGGLPSVIPGKTGLEFQWRVQQARAAKIVYVIGDSRVDWGFGDRLFTQTIKKLYGRDIHAVNAGLSAGSVRKITRFILDNHPGKAPGILVINFSPASLYHFRTSPGKAVPNIKRQDFFDHRITNYLVEKLFTYGRGAAFLYRHFQEYQKRGYQRKFGWFSRTLFSEGFINAKGGNNDGSKRIRDVSFYRRVFHKIRKQEDYYRKRKEETIRVLREAQMLGWQVILVRFPIGDKMLKLELELPDLFQPERIAQELTIQFIDYDADPRTADLPSDESHLFPDSAREISNILAHDVSQLLVSGS